MLHYKDVIIMCLYRAMKCFIHSAGIAIVTANYEKNMRILFLNHLIYSYMVCGSHRVE